MTKKEYGPHKYPDQDSTNDCEHHCGCWAGPSSSGGPLGLDPLSGKCPRNPLDGTILGRNLDYEEVVRQRIADLERRAYIAETKLKAVEPEKFELAEKIKLLQAKIFEYEKFAEAIRQAFPGIGLQPK